MKFAYFFVSLILTSIKIVATKSWELKLVHKYILHRCIHDNDLKWATKNSVDTVVIIAQGREFELAPNAIILNPERRGFFIPNINSFISFYAPLGYTLKYARLSKRPNLSDGLLNDLELYTE